MSLTPMDISSYSVEELIDCLNRNHVTPFALDQCKHARQRQYSKE